MKGTSWESQNDKRRKERIKRFLTLLIIIAVVVLQSAVTYKQEKAAVLAHERREALQREITLKKQVFEKSFEFGQRYGNVSDIEKELYWTGGISREEHEEFKKLEDNFIEKDCSNESFLELVNYYSGLHDRLAKYHNMRFVEGCDSEYFILGLKFYRRVEVVRNCLMMNMISITDYSYLEEISKKIYRSPTKKLVEEYILKSGEILSQMY